MTTTKHLTDEEALAIFESGEGFEPAPGEYTPLGRIVLAREARERADALLTDAVAAGRRAGLTWEQIGTGLGITKEGARKRHGAAAALVKQDITEAAVANWLGVVAGLTDVEREALLEQYPELSEIERAKVNGWMGLSGNKGSITGTLGRPPKARSRKGGTSGRSGKGSESGKSS